MEENYNQELSEAIRQYEENQNNMYGTEEVTTVQREVQSKKGSLGFGSLFFFVGLLFFIIGIFVNIKESEFYETAVATQATITSIEKEFNSASDETDYTVMVQYTIDGNDYETALGFYSSNWKEGKELTVYYDPEDPCNVKCKIVVGNISLVPLLAIGLGGIAMLVGIFSSGILCPPIKEEVLLCVSPEKANMMISINSAKADVIYGILPIFIGLFFVIIGIVGLIGLKNYAFLISIAMGGLTTFVVVKGMIDKCTRYRDLKEELQRMY